MSFTDFVITPTRSTGTKIAKYPGTRLVGTAFKLTSSFAHVLYKILNLVIFSLLFCGGRIHNARAGSFFLLTKPFVLWRSRFRRLSSLLSSLLT